ncbi:hypothetical protein BOH78_4840 [Pichia kudriavzevii]|uniref:Uncharacterized protein n=1 Tax=Pichia kudriavzevii TaxID=4909 RepID=A0A1V2LG80_PICKU|nr:hypothetical protein BOH78_4840 [Pichia kudriavzevii]
MNSQNADQTNLDNVVNYPVLLFVVSAEEKNNTMILNCDNFDAFVSSSTLNTLPPQRDLTHGNLLKALANFNIN